MVCVANYDENGAVIGCTREDGVGGGLEFIEACEALGLTITYKSQAEIDSLIVAQEQAEFRADREPLLKEADIEINKLEDNSQDSTSWRTYRQALRDSTIDWTFPPKPNGGV